MNSLCRMSSCPFCEIVASLDAASPSASIVFEDQRAVGFLDRSPVFKGHVLVIPRQHVVTLSDLPTPAIGPFFERVQRIAAAVEDGVGADGTFVAMNNIVSQSVAHLHVHIVPRRRKDGLRGFFWPRQKYASDAEADEYATRIASALRDC